MEKEKRVMEAHRMADAVKSCADETCAICAVWERLREGGSAKYIRRLMNMALDVCEEFAAGQRKQADDGLATVFAQGKVLTVGEMIECIRKSEHFHSKLFLSLKEKDGSEYVRGIKYYGHDKYGDDTAAISYEGANYPYTQDEMLHDIYSCEERYGVHEEYPVIIWDKYDGKPTHYAVSITDCGVEGTVINCIEADIDALTLEIDGIKI